MYFSCFNNYVITQYIPAVPWAPEATYSSATSSKRRTILPRCFSSTRRACTCGASSSREALSGTPAGPAS